MMHPERASRGRAHHEHPSREWSGSKDTKELEKTIQRLNEENARPQRWMLWLTAIAAVGAAIAAWPVVNEWLHALGIR